MTGLKIPIFTMIATLAMVSTVIALFAMAQSKQIELHYGLRQDYFSCSQAEGQLQLTAFTTPRPDPKILWEEFRKDVRTPIAMFQPEKGSDPETVAAWNAEFERSLFLTKPHFLAEVNSSVRDMEANSPFILRSWGMRSQGEIYPEVEMLNPTSGEFLDRASGVPLIFPGCVSQIEDQAHESARKRVLAWYRSRGVYPVNSVYRKKL